MAVDAAVTRGRAGTKYSGKKPDRGSEDCRRSQINSTFAFNPCPRHYFESSKCIDHAGLGSLGSLSSFPGLPWIFLATTNKRNDG